MKEVNFEFELPEITKYYASMLPEDGDIQCHIDTKNGQVDVSGEGNAGTWIVTEMIRLGYVCLALAAGDDGGKYSDPMIALDMITRNAKRIIEHNTVEVS